MKEKIAPDSPRFTIDLKPESFDIKEYRRRHQHKLPQDNKRKWF
jgi:hypothetical protein